MDAETHNGGDNLHQSLVRLDIHRRLTRLENLLKPLMDEQIPGDDWNPLANMMDELEKKQDIPSAWDD